MKPPLGLLHGPKFNNNHSTIIEDSIPVIQLAKNLPEVKKIILGRIIVCGNGKRRIKFQPIQAGLKAIVRGGITQQDFFVYTSNPVSTQKAIENMFNND